MAKLRAMLLNVKNFFHDSAVYPSEIGVHFRDQLLRLWIFRIFLRFLFIFVQYRIAWSFKPSFVKWFAYRSRKVFHGFPCCAIRYKPFIKSFLSLQHFLRVFLTFGSQFFCNYKLFHAHHLIDSCSLKAYKI